MVAIGIEKGQRVGDFSRVFESKEITEIVNHCMFCLMIAFCYVHAH